MKIQQNFPYDVKVIEDWIPLSDNTNLWMKAWHPVTDMPLPAILEYLPYRAGDWTAPRDHERHPFYAGFGYVSIRVDIRGHGNSEGIPGDEYDSQELSDGVEVINWISRQEWCSGKVGMFGISWGGFNALQLASLQPEPLKAIVTACSTDDRYDNDVHYFGGSMLAVDMHAWAGTMLAFESRPPDPRVWGERWKDQWLYRLNHMEPYLDTWLSHQRRDEYWQHGSVCENYDKINAAVLAVGGWYDPYRDAVLRLVENLSALGKNVKGLLGPWEHQYPDRNIGPDPHIDFLGETLCWWDYWLKGEDTDVMGWPLLRAWITDSVRPASSYNEIPGRWIAETTWPSPQVDTQLFQLDDASVSPVSSVTPNVDGIQVLTVDSPQDTGVLAGSYFPYGNAGDLPIDQRSDDGKSAVLDFVLTDDLDIFGNAAVNLRVSSEATRGQVYVRLCDVATDGSSTQITRGNLNLSSRKGRDKIVPFPVGDWEYVTVTLSSIGYRIPAGHVLRVAVSTAYWPWIWPQPEARALRIALADSQLQLPVRLVPQPSSQAGELDASVSFSSPRQSESLNVISPEASCAGEKRPERLISMDVAENTTNIQVDPAYGGTRIYPDGLEYDEDAVERYWIAADNPLSARTEAQWRIEMRRPDLNWKARIEADTRIHCDETNFYTESVVCCYHGNELVFDEVWNEKIPRETS
jgi:putative CocE/NonD family hydrolase